MDTWGEPGGMGGLFSTSAIVLEGILEPGELLYFPPGALHAAMSLDPAVMFAANGNSYYSTREFRKACRKAILRASEG